MTTRMPRSCAASRTFLKSSSSRRSDVRSCSRRCRNRRPARAMGRTAAARGTSRQGSAGNPAFVQAQQIADAVRVAVAERLDGQLVDDGVLVPERIVRGPRSSHAFAFWTVPAEIITKRSEGTALSRSLSPTVCLGHDPKLLHLAGELAWEKSPPPIASIRAGSIHARLAAKPEKVLRRHDRGIRDRGQRGTDEFPVDLPSVQTQIAASVRALRLDLNR